MKTQVSILSVVAIIETRADICRRWVVSKCLPLTGVFLSDLLGQKGDPGQPGGRGENEALFCVP